MMNKKTGGIILLTALCMASYIFGNELLINQNYVTATATIDGDDVLVSAPAITNPQWVRFAWHEIAEPNLMNKEKLPANSFPATAVLTGAVKKNKRL